MTRRIHTHPGEVLAEEFMTPHGLTATALARRLAVPTNRVTKILRGERAVTADTALRLGRCFGTSAEFWMNLQFKHDLSTELAQSGQRIERTVEPLTSNE